jgi:hypothetical protein
MPGTLYSISESYLSKCLSIAQTAAAADREVRETLMRHDPRRPEHSHEGALLCSISTRGGSVVQIPALQQPGLLFRRKLLTRSSSYVALEATRVYTRSPD